jgi:putative glutamine amidotransferase
MSDDRPLIGVTASDGKSWINYQLSHWALHRAGARAHRITPAQRVDLARLDGVLIGGGDHIGMDLYGGAPMPDVRIDRARDRLELELIGHADAHSLPMLGVCRGAQILNAYFGGTLYQDIYSVYQDLPRRWTGLPFKHVHIEPGSQLGALLATGRCKVNALHTQSIEKLGRGLVAVAHDEYGIIQGVESRDDRFIFGVQWHPELIIYSRTHRRLFDGLAHAAATRRRAHT